MFLRTFILILLLTTGSIVEATTVLGVGSTSCLQFVTDSKSKRNFVNTQKGVQYYSWTEGFITSQNAQLEEAAGKNKSPDRILRWLVDYCEANPLDNYFTANEAYFDNLIGQ